VKRVKRQAALTAALETFLEHGYAGTSLQRIAGRARVSTATLYKSFPTKAALFEAIVPELWALTAARNTPVAIGDPRSGLRTIGREIAAVCRHPTMLGFYRVFIAESRQFPELGRSLLEHGKMPYLSSIRAYLDAEMKQGNLSGWDGTRAASQFFAMIADQLFWPVLLSPDSAGTAERADDVVEEAISTILARYAFEGSLGVP
jgi:AcrR family transcriptional regulator